MIDFIVRPYVGDQDLATMVQLIQARPAVCVLDYPSIYELYELLGTESRQANTQLWQNAEGHLLGFAIVDLQFNTMWTEMAAKAPSETLFAAMIDWGAERVRQPHKAIHNAGVLQISCRDDNVLCIDRLTQHGFQQQDWYTVHLARPLHEPFSAPELPPDFTIRAVTGEEEAAAVAALHRAAFGTEAMTTENRLAMMRVPEYDRTLDWVAVAPDGTLAAYVMGSISQAENTLTGIARGYTDPVATHPNYQRRGLARTLLLTGLQILKARGMTEAALNTGSWNTAMQATAHAVGYQIIGTTRFFHKQL